MGKALPFFYDSAPVWRKHKSAAKKKTRKKEEKKEKNRRNFRIFLTACTFIDWWPQISVLEVPFVDQHLSRCGAVGAADYREIGCFAGQEGLLPPETLRVKCLTE